MPGAFLLYTICVILSEVGCIGELRIAACMAAIDASLAQHDQRSTPQKKRPSFGGRFYISK
ncbi:hypothetical protein GWR56_12395 [Mucilaginibacter sp. 14171R-50]|uniref:hypothetical protein n=1 Tax=Mucilaginibacter sp. 14171R-50 TaxID=2703789 RepID=UPI00138B4F3D|nr:hypothetical protein [Mucilaginibacter sp. 14171R-50]QHS56297.1 hypothetical protein GWR56_12395 [Mucilaginibacter sp. 14171R-50]